jgi:hypothetical protein
MLAGRLSPFSPAWRLHYTRQNPTALQRFGEVELSGPVPLRASDEEGILRAAFRDAHGARLSGFALLVTLGDQALAASLAADALCSNRRRDACPDVRLQLTKGEWRRLRRSAWMPSPIERLLR